MTTHFLFYIISGISLERKDRSKKSLKIKGYYRPVYYKFIPWLVIAQNIIFETL